MVPRSETTDNMQDADIEALAVWDGEEVVRTKFCQEGVLTVPCPNCGHVGVQKKYIGIE
jgi:hypothetical protein